MTLKRVLQLCGVLALGAIPCAAGVSNIFDIGKISLDPPYYWPAIAPFTASCPPYPDCPAGNPTTWQQGFPVENIFGAHIQTPEGTYNTIFQNGDYDNVYFHLTNQQPVTGSFDVTVTGSQDGPGNPFRSFSYFDLYSYSGGDLTSPSSYTLLFSSGPVTPGANGSEVVHGTVSLSAAGPDFVYQFGAPDGGPRIFGVDFSPAGSPQSGLQETTPEPGFYGVLALGVIGLVAARRRNA